MFYKKLTALAAIALSIPFIGLTLNQYNYISSFPYGNYVHSSIALGSITSRLLFLVGVIGLVGGVIKPKLVLWVGEKSRFRVLVVYGVVLALSLITYHGSKEARDRSAIKERANISALYKNLSPGMKTKDILQEAHKIDASIGYHYGDTSPNNRLSGFPYDGETKPALVLKYPPFRSQPIITVEMSASPGEPESVARKIVLMDRNKVIEVSPALVKSDPQVIWGHLALARESQVFTRCGTKKSIEVDLSEVKQEHFMESYNGVAEGDQKVFAIISGAVDSAKNCENCPPKEKIKIFGFSVLALEVKQQSRCLN
jgi:hypothetical protein